MSKWNGNIDMDFIELYNGMKLPNIALGTSSIGYAPNYHYASSKNGLLNRILNRLKRNSIRKQEEDFINAICHALLVGYRLIDTSAAYSNEIFINRAILRSKIPRNEVFLTGRISNQAQFAGSKAVKSQIEDILHRNGSDKIDLLMFHWPVTGCYESTWKVICDAYESGIAKAIGVANCHRHHLENLMKCGLKPMVNQFEVHPLFTQKQLIQYCNDQGIVVESYSAIARYDDRLMRLPALLKIAKKYGKSPVQVVLRWHVQQGLIPIVRSMNKQRIMENIDIFDFTLEKNEIQIIDSFNINARIRYDPDNCDFTIL